MADILHNNFLGDNLGATCQRMCPKGFHIEPPCTCVPNRTIDATPEKTTNKTFMVIGGLIILGFLVSQSVFR